MPYVQYSSAQLVRGEWRRDLLQSSYDVANFHGPQPRHELQLSVDTCNKANAYVKAHATVNSLTSALPTQKTGML